MAALLGTAALAGACTGQDLEDPWRETTVAWEPGCSEGCVTLRADDFGHIGQLEVKMNPLVDDPVAQWGGCLSSFIRCMDEGGDVLSCNAESTCPAPCRDELSRRARDLTTEAARMDAFEEVFVRRGGVCRPTAPAQVTP